ncbi:MAG: selenide, water dikinase SelD [Gammaproteobacteria bacterium]
MRDSKHPVVTDIVLVGGGHSHVAVLKHFGMRPLDGVRLTLITRDIETPYSGMLPGHIAGHYTFEQTHIDLRPLAQFAGARLYHDEMVGLDPNERRVLLRARPPVAYDLLSIDIGSAPSRIGIDGAEHVLAVKPVDRFLVEWQALRERARRARGPFRIVVVGAGAGGVELTLSMQHRLRGDGVDTEFHLVNDQPAILTTHNPRVRRIFERLLRERAVRVYTGHKVARVQPTQALLDDGRALAADAIVWVTNASAPTWLAQTGLATTADGFVAVNDCLQSTSHPNVFAAGDIATIVNHPRPKSGVIAVRSGPPLADNLRRAAAGEPLKPFRPQRQFLALIGTGDLRAVASRRVLALEGAWVWRLKHWIDERWMRGYQQLPAMTPPPAPSPAATSAPDISAIAMRCGGCGSKVGSQILTRALARLSLPTRDDVVVGLADPDDAAVVRVPPGKLMVHTVDFFRALIDDPYLFGIIAAHHSLSDIYAMGATPQSALAIATLPIAPEAKMEQDLYQLLRGATQVLADAEAALVGGHTSEGAELAFGLSVNGLADPERLLRKGGMRAGDKLILTKPLGTGTLFAADMRRQARGRWVEAAIDSMLQSNRDAAACVREYGAHACTDVTGFGLLGHLIEMTRPSNVDAEIDLSALPILDGAETTVALGILSSLAPDNVRLRRALRDLEHAARHPRYPLLFDPQTSGGLLASVPPERAAACVAALRARGYRAAAIIGEVKARSDDLAPIALRG